MKRSGFTLVEMLVVLAVIAALSTFILANMISASEQSRDADRKADLVAMQTAIELYKQKHSRYPEGCNGPNAWSGQVDSDYACSNTTGNYNQFVGTNRYIVGDPAAPDFNEFMPVLPNDKFTNGTNSGYRYLVNTDGTVYKLMAFRTVESVTVDNSTDLRSCDVNDANTGICDGSTPNWCRESNPNFQTSFGVWGGFANGADAAASLTNTRAVICDIP